MLGEFGKQVIRYLSIFLTFDNTFLVFPWNCKDDENWRDPYYIKFGHGTRRCADLTYDSCRDSIKMYDNGSVYYDYYTELMRACPKSCGLCIRGRKMVLFEIKHALNLKI